MFNMQGANAAANTEPKRSPADFLKAVLGRPVNVRLNAGTDYKGAYYLGSNDYQ